MEVKLIRLLSTINKFYIFFLLRLSVYIVGFEQTLYIILAPLRRFLSGFSRRMWNGSSIELFVPLCETNNFKSFKSMLNNNFELTMH